MPMSSAAVPDFSLPSTGGSVFKLSDAKAAKLVLYFYPKDATPGCTTETLDFAALHDQFKKAGAEIYGISRDSLKSHENFKAQLGFDFELLSDTDEKVCQQFGVIKQKIMYGKPVRGIERSTFVLDADRNIAREWRGLKVPGHVEEVLDFVKSI
jgi:thioredoxin-dependent peroxiredoxin